MIFFASASATEIYEYGQSVRALGMGNAYTAIVDDTDTMFYNPAGLAKVRGMNWTLLNLNVGLSGTNYTEISDKISSYQSTTDLENFYGDQIWLGYAGKSVLALPYFGVGVYLSGNVSFVMHNPAYPSLTPQYIYDTGFVIGGAFPIAPMTYLGIIGKRIVRVGSEQVVSLGTVATGETSDITSSLNNRGTALGMDLGLNFVFPGDIVKPTVSFVWKDVGYTTFSKDVGTSAPPAQKDEQIVGVGAEFDLPLMTLSTALDYKHINLRDENLGKKLHVGAELSLPILDIRGGFSQGYYTYGVGVDFWLLRFDVATYGVEMGVYPGQQEDRRYQAQLTLELSFDPDFNILNQSGKKRKLKKRR